jgi:pimeloyl-ACP methyl ester carboxylesterase
MRPTLVTLMTISLWSFHVESKAVLPVVGSKRFDVAITSISLTDSDRPDPFANDKRKRSIVISGFNPVTTCQKKQLQPYMPPATAVFQDDKYAAYGLPNGSFQSLSLDTCQNYTQRKPLACSSGPLPIVIFSGGLGTSRLIYSSMLQSIAANGYLVISLDHPYDTDIVEFPDGTITNGIDLSSDAKVELALKTRTEDHRFLIRRLTKTSLAERLFRGNVQGERIPHIATVGHSLGGAAAVNAMLHDKSISAAMNIDGSMFGDVLTSGFDRPFMLIGHENKTQETDPSWKTVWPLVRGWKKEIEVRGAAHYSFSDLPLLTAVLGLQDQLPEEVGQVLGTVEGHRMTKLTVKFVTSFLDMMFKSRVGNELDAGFKEFPEVVEVA